MSELQRPGSISSPPPPTSAAGGAFNGVKIGLALLLVGGVPLWLAVDHLVSSPLAQLAVMAGYGLAGMGWTMLRTRRILRDGRHGPQ